MQKMKANSVADLVKMAGRLHDSPAVSRSDTADYKPATHRDQLK